MHTVIITADFYNLLPFSMSETSLHIPAGRFVHHHLFKSWTLRRCMPLVQYDTPWTRLVIKGLMTFEWPLKLRMYPCIQFGVEKIETSCFVSTEWYLWIYINCCVIFKRNYGLLLQLSDSHVVPSISNNYNAAVLVHTYNYRTWS